MAKIADVQEIAIEELQPYANNAKMHGPEQVDLIAQSIEEFGFISPCLIDKDKRIIAGHGRVEAAKQLGMERVPCLFIEGLSEEQYKAYILADNRLTELGEWDTDLVSEELEDLRESGFNIEITGFSIDDIIITDDMGAEMTEEEFEEKAASAPPRCKPGQVWKLGVHRLMCGDSTKPEDVKKLMAGERSNLLLTDPPYNVALGSEYSGSKDDARKRHRRTDGLVIANDAFESDEAFIEFLTEAFSNADAAMQEGAAFYIWYASQQALNFMNAAENTGWQIRQNLIWNKNVFTLGRQDYQWKHEPCLYGWKDGAAHYFINIRSLSSVQGQNLDDLSREELQNIIRQINEATDVQDEKRPARSAQHPTMKPLALFERLVRNSTRPGEAVLDIFGGSGTTLMACEELGRRCYMMEYDERYCSAIIDRWEEETGKKAELTEGSEN